MGKSIPYLLTAIILIVGLKLIAALFYEDFKPVRTKGKLYKGKIAAKKTNKKVPEEVIFSKEIERDTTKKEEVISKSSDNSNAKKTLPNKAIAVEENGLPNDTYFQDLKNSYLSPILANLSEGRSREDIVVRYYKHTMDSDKVYAIRSLGYYLHEKEAEDGKDLESNVLYYGSDVDERDIQLVAFTLLENGIPLKSIAPSQYTWKYNALEIGTDSLLQNLPILKISDIEVFSR